MNCPRCKGKGKKIDIIQTDLPEGGKDTPVYQCTKCKTVFREYEDGHTMIMREHISLLINKYLK